MVKTPDVVVLGGGIIGALSAYELAKSGAHVLLHEKYKFGVGASGNSAAMLELQLDAYRGAPFVPLARRSHELFPDTSSELRRQTGIDIQFRRCSILQLALNQAEQESLTRECERQQRDDLNAKWLSSAEIKKQFPSLTEQQCGGALYVDDGMVNGGRFLEAAIAAAKGAGAIVKEQAGGFSLRSALAKGIKVVVAAGAWTDDVLSEIDVKLGVSPVRGQLIVYETPQPVLPFPVYTKTGGYITPREDGTTLAGTTIENVGFDLNTTTAGRTHIQALIKTLMPSLLEKRELKMTSGLRPKSPDDLPLIGPLPQHPNVIVATGHYRNGILLAPITSKIVSAMIQNKPLTISVDSFLPTRLLSQR